MGTLESFLRRFYSRQNGNWDDNNTWTFSQTHVGVSAGAYPNNASDRVFIGNGHTVEHNSTNAIFSLQVGSSPNPASFGQVNILTGTYLDALYFELATNATLGIQPSTGIQAGT